LTAALPPLLDARREGAGVRVRLRVPADLDCFEGHFPGHPVVPGFVQLGWAMGLAREHRLGAGDPAAIEALKYRSFLLPEAEVEVALDPIVSGVRFAFQSDGVELSSGRVVLAASLPQHTPEPLAFAAASLPVRIPQSGPMRVIEAVTHHDGGVTISTARVGDAAPISRGGRAPAWLALELLAQGMAAQGGLVLAGGDPPPQVFLVGARRIELRTRSFAAGERLWVRVEHQRGETGLVVCECALGTGVVPTDAAAARARALAWGPLKAFVGAPGVGSAN
jgi:predicted hotdog family 3-hydroxylacyl-ACP dehydratase/3-hydroxymyristoyl/3-hydroxydecanoyl-(acyl carrier protein) dehydratase